MPPDFSGQNLRGRNFKGQNLTGANFSYADIQGANFSNAILIGANFTKAKAGMQPWRRNMFLLSCLGAMVLALTLVVSQTLAMFVAALFINSIAPAIAVAIVGAVVMAVIGAVFICAVGTVHIALSVLFAVTNLVIVAIVVTAVGSGSNALPVTIIVAIIFGLLSSYISWRALAGDPKITFAFVRSLAISIAAVNGTSFHCADLTDANFTQTKLKNTDLTKAVLTRTRFNDAQELDLARVDSTILVDPSVRDLLVTGNSRQKSYLGANIRGANLIGADLSYANLKKADITDATFQGANLEWANLTLTQAIGTDFTSAQMTGACVEGWNIESNTKLDNVDCRFIYLLENPKPKTDDRERRPSSGEFKPGEFTKLFEEVLTTVDLIFDKGIDWKAFIAAFKKVQVENEDTELTIQSIENKGDGVIVVRVSVPPDANKEKIHSDFTQNYALALKAIEEKYKAELQAKDREIQIYREQNGKIENIILTMSKKEINIEVRATSESKSMSEASKYDQRGAQFAGGFAETVQRDQIGGNIHNYTAPQNLAEAEKYIQQLLQEMTRLEEKYKSEIAAKDEEIAANRQQIDHLRELAEKLAKTPIVIKTIEKG
ncbi:pentapeptide repeat-containing protein [Aerosakkonema sp. BLCC-F183]|uniref:pentapeptide repeat-containing protein n=1 Tax=Aerosakkonema sp. BLCC-F183 TaxID=3342834 RepID=UPI0035BA9047